MGGINFKRIDCGDVEEEKKKLQDWNNAMGTEKINKRSSERERLLINWRKQGGK